MATAGDSRLTDLGELGPVGAWIDDPAFRRSQFFAEFLNRLVTGRDMNIIITAASETGVGKTTLAVALALLMDQYGWTHDKACVANPVKYDRLYDQSAPGSVLILDEAEKAMDARRGMKKESVQLTQSFATKRYRQVFSILTAPSKSWVDKRLGGDAADYWIQCEQTPLGRIAGEADVYRIKENEHANKEYTEKTERIAWPSLDRDPEFQLLDKRKQEILETDDDSQTYYHRDEVEDMVAQREKDARKEYRKEIIASLNDQPDITQQTIAEAFDMSRSWVSRLANAD